MRLFLAIGLPDGLRLKLAELQRELARDLTGWAWVRPESLHLTLRFLGQVEPVRDVQLRQRWRGASAAAGRMTLEFKGLGCFPSRGRARVLWVGVRDRPAGALRGLAYRIEQAAREGGFEAKDRPFRGHLTLGRAQRGCTADRPERLDHGIAMNLRVSQVRLYESELRADGARYTALEGYTLGDATIEDHLEPERED